MVTEDALNESRSDRELVALARDGDDDAADELVVRHHAAVFRIALGIVGNEDTAADVTQETFLKVLRNLRKFRGESAFRTWLLSIAANEARGFLRKTRRRSEVSLDDAPPVAAGNPSPSDALERDEDSRRLREGLEHLPEKQRLVVSMRIYEGMSYREIAEVIGSSEGAARVNYHHGVNRLREILA
jgi:RNA polymerase sigma-70 factor (ECF subfamily)